MATSKAARNEILLEAADLQPGETRTIVCPQCNGGSSRDRSCSITRKESGIIAWICFRDSCKIKGTNKGGAAPAVAAPEKEKTEKEVRTSTILKEPTSKLPPEVATYALTQYNIDLESNFVRWITKLSPEGKGRIAIPILSRFMDLHGYDLKDIYKEQKPKSMTLKGSYTGCAWFLDRAWPARTLVLVEDTLSAMAVRELGDVDAVALLGTHLTEPMIEDINDGGYSVVLIALDKDALATALKAVSSSTIKNSKVLSLEKDIKNMTVENRRILIEPHIISSRPS